MTSMQQNFNFFFEKILDNFVLLDPLKSYHNIILLIPPVGLEKTFSVSWIKFQKKVYGLNGFDTFFAHFSTEFLVFACICCCFHSHKNCCDVLLIIYA